MANRVSLIFIAAVFLFSIVAIHSPSATGLSGSSFKPGRIIDDSVFFKGNAMTASQVQSFLNAKRPTCDTYGKKMIYDSSRGDTVTRKTYAARRGVSTPFTCLKNYKVNTPARSAETGLCKSLGAKTGRTAAQIINDVANACGVSQKVLIVLLQKEQSLVTDDWPWPIQYRSATGYGCPDTAACDSRYYGYFNQVYNGARIYKYYDKIDGPNYRAHRTNYIQWHPRSSCGGSNVYIENQATAGLYNYTPYRPNSAALNNLYGTGNSCSSYGNRNFWRMYNDWFGSSIRNLGFKTLDRPRWMELRTNSSKKDLPAEANNNIQLASGQQIYFSSKLEIDGRVYLRTRSDTTTNLNMGVLITDLKEIDLQYEPLDTPRWMQLKSSSYRKHPVTERVSAGKLSSGRHIHFGSKTTINGLTFLRTTYDTDRNIHRVIPASKVSDIEVDFISMKSPRWMKTTSATEYISPATEAGSGTSVIQNTPLLLAYKISVGNETYMQTSSDKSSDLKFGIPMSDIVNVYTTLDKPRTLRLNTDAYKLNPFTGAQAQNHLFTEGTKIFFTTKTFENGQWYLRTQHDTNLEENRGFLLTNLDNL